MWIPCLGEPFGDPPQCSDCSDKPPPMLGSHCWIRPFSHEMPNPSLSGDSDVWESGGQVLLWILLPFISAGAQGSPGTANLPGGVRAPGAVGPAPQLWMPQGQIWQRDSQLG